MSKGKDNRNMKSGVPETSWLMKVLRSKSPAPSSVPLPVVDDDRNRNSDVDAVDKHLKEFVALRHLFRSVQPHGHAATSAGTGTDVAANWSPSGITKSHFLSAKDHILVAEEFCKSQQETESSILDSDSIEEGVTAANRANVVRLFLDYDGPLSTDFLFIIQEELLAGVDDHSTPPLKSTENIREKIDSYVESVAEILRRDDIDLYEKAALALLGFLDIRPFSEGVVAQVSRMIMNWVLKRGGLPFIVSLTATDESHARYQQLVHHCLVETQTQTQTHARTQAQTHARTQAHAQLSAATATATAARPMADYIASCCLIAWQELSRRTREKEEYAERTRVDAELRIARQSAQSGSCIVCLDNSPNMATLCCGAPVHFNCIVEWMSSPERQLQPVCVQCRKTFPRGRLLPSAAAAAAGGGGGRNADGQHQPQAGGAAVLDVIHGFGDRIVVVRNDVTQMTHNVTQMTHDVNDLNSRMDLLDRIFTLTRPPSHNPPAPSPARRETAPHVTSTNRPVQRAVVPPPPPSQQQQQQPAARPRCRLCNTNYPADGCGYSVCARCCTNEYGNCGCVRHGGVAEGDNDDDDDADDDEDDADDDDDRCLVCNNQLLARGCIYYACGSCCTNKYGNHGCVRHGGEESVAGTWECDEQDEKCSGCHRNKPANDCYHNMCGACCSHEHGNYGCLRHGGEPIVVVAVNVMCRVCERQRFAKDCCNEMCGNCCNRYNCRRHS